MPAWYDYLPTKEVKWQATVHIDPRYDSQWKVPTSTQNVTMPDISYREYVDQTIKNIVVAKYGNRSDQYGFIIGDTIEVLERGPGSFVSEHFNGIPYYRVSLKARVVDMVDGATTIRTDHLSVARITPGINLVCVCDMIVISIPANSYPSELTSFITDSTSCAEVTSFLKKKVTWTVRVISSEAQLEHINAFGVFQVTKASPSSK